MAIFTAPKGTKDWFGASIYKRNFLLDCIKNTFEKYGFSPIETPAFERLSTLLEKYGQEGEQLLFKILNSGNPLRGLSLEEAGEILEQPFDQLSGLSKKKLAQNINAMAEKGLRYDLTIPMARFVVEHQEEIDFPFRRYQIQPVWRADRPQKGRYQEFYQADADILGTASLWAEIDLMHILCLVFETLKLPVRVLFNHRKVLEAILKKCDWMDQFESIAAVIDKKDKIGLEGVFKLLYQIEGMNENKIAFLQNYLELSGTNKEKTQAISGLLGDNQKDFFTDLHFLIDYFPISSTVSFELTPYLVRGLSYYTGFVFEVIPTYIASGSIAAGGRYDGLTDLFGLKGIEGVGLSFGVDRILDVLEQQDFPVLIENNLDIFCLNFGDIFLKDLYPVLILLRKKYKIDFYPQDDKLKKQMKYAQKKAAKWVLLYGEDEKNTTSIKIKNMQSGIEEKIPFLALENFEF